MSADIREINLESLVDEVQDYKNKGFRLVTMSCNDLGDDNMDILYHLDKNMDMDHLRLIIPKGTVVPSITGVYLCAFLVENEIKELLGIEFSDLALDFQGHLYHEQETRKLPFCKVSVASKEGK